MNVSRIQRYSVHDGPGIRTTVFLKGCTLSCAWCHNPETIPAEPVLLYDRSKCLACGECAKACPRGAIAERDGAMAVDRVLCTVCGACPGVCPAAALSMNGQEMDTDQILRVVLRDSGFYQNTGGGVTVSGGEPLLQPLGTAALLKKFREAGVHTAVDTAGNVGFESFSSVMEHTDLFLYDLKVMDGEKHAKYTGADNRLILDNLARLYLAGKAITIRVPVIPGVNDGEDDIKALAACLARFPRLAAPEFLPMHKMASGKYKNMGLSNRFYETRECPDDRKIAKVAETFKSNMAGA